MDKRLKTLHKGRYTNVQLKDTNIMNITLIRKMQIQITMRYHKHPLKWPEFKRPLTPDTVKDVKPLECSYIAGENVKWHYHFG